MNHRDSYTPDPARHVLRAPADVTLSSRLVCGAKWFAIWMAAAIAVVILSPFALIVYAAGKGQDTCK